MPIDDAAGLVVEAYSRMRSGEVFVLKMPAFRVGTLAESMVEQYAPAFGHDPEDIDIDIIGPRPGERTHEHLVSVDEVPQTRELDDMYAIFPSIDVGGYGDIDYSDADQLDEPYKSADAHILSKDELIELLESTAVVDKHLP
jgi:FlaA1/EpsC-like NDP-sugar epimerase